MNRGSVLQIAVRVALVMWVVEEIEKELPCECLRIVFNKLPEGRVGVKCMVGGRFSGRVLEVPVRMRLENASIQWKFLNTMWLALAEEEQDFVTGLALGALGDDRKTLFGSIAETTKQWMLEMCSNAAEA